MLRTKLLTDIREDTTSLFLDVIGIKVTRPTRKEFGPFKAYYRTLDLNSLAVRCWRLLAQEPSKNT